MEKYTTIQGDTWDSIAFKVYGGETYTSYLMANNYPYLDILVFSSGVLLNTPGLPEYEQGELPPWRSGSKVEDEEVDPYDDYSGEGEE